ncbi:hypothetical protein [Winogradskyella helgolandensis]|uniref:hypothetical protein n=1 Tax=Winogradskyella helgolandensis TaxID=2697010 RepID=UPI0015BA5FAE|nr:hypothetical protein [Winogradskyella helgolandensis]
MFKLTQWFLKLSPLKIFLLLLLGIPIYIWFFSIIYQLDNKVNQNSSNLKFWIAGCLVIYPMIYMLYVLFTFSFFVPLMPFHLLAILCGFILMILTAKSYVNFEKKKGYSTRNVFEVFMMLWFYIICVWSLQRNLNTYVTEIPIQN